MRKLEGKMTAEISTSMAPSLRALSDPMQRGLVAGKEVGHAARGDHGRRPLLWLTGCLPRTLG